MEKESCRIHEQQFPQPKASNFNFLLSNFQSVKNAN